MGRQLNAPVIIKRRKIVVAERHHGGAWKVAYADFVTAMMAFFMMLWLISSTTDDKREGIADYFAPTIPISRVSGGGDGLFGGSSVMSADSQIQDGTGTAPAEHASVLPGEAGDPDQGEMAAETAALREIEDSLLGRGGESLLSDQALRHVVTRLTDEGLIIEIFALEDSPLFHGQTAEPMPIVEELAKVLGRVFGIVTNQVAVTGHTGTPSVLRRDNEMWSMSTNRATTMRRLLEASDLPQERVERVTGHADRKLATRNPMAARNERLEIVLLRRLDVRGR